MMYVDIPIQQLMKILVVEDEPDIQLGLKYNLEHEGYEVDTAGNGREGLEKASENSFNLIILDVQLPEISGFDICRKLREHKVFTPIIMLTGKSDDFDKVLGLELGADDYMTKPFNVRELLARIKAILRRGNGSDPETQQEENDVNIGKLKLNFSGYIALDEEDKEVHLSHKEIDIIRYLYENKNETVSRRELLEKIWGYDETPTTRTVDNFILKIRHKLEDNPNSPKIIHTVHGIGYKLLA
jgi:DNA-binding response OmpR family regulator